MPTKVKKEDQLSREEEIERKSQPDQAACEIETNHVHPEARKTQTLSHPKSCFIVGDPLSPGVTETVVQAMKQAWTSVQKGSLTKVYKENSGGKREKSFEVNHETGEIIPTKAGLNNAAHFAAAIHHKISPDSPIEVFAYGKKSKPTVKEAQAMTATLLEKFRPGDSPRIDVVVNGQEAMRNGVIPEGTDLDGVNNLQSIEKKIQKYREDIAKRLASGENFEETAAAGPHLELLTEDQASS